MRYNATFSTYRRETSGSKRSYSASATITAGIGFLTTLDGRTKATLGLANSIEAYQLLTEQTNIERKDKFVISGVDYFAESVEKIDAGSQRLTKIILNTLHE